MRLNFSNAMTRTLDKLQASDEVGIYNCIADLHSAMDDMSTIPRWTFVDPEIATIPGVTIRMSADELKELHRLRIIIDGTVG